MVVVSTVYVLENGLERPHPSGYQLAFLTPGISPSSASSRKQIRQMPNLRYTARGRPHNRQRLFRRVENFAGCSALILLALHAIASAL
jgi:hypothetical protein